VDLYIHSLIRLHGVVLNYLSTGTTLPLLAHLTSLPSLRCDRPVTNLNLMLNSALHKTDRCTRSWPGFGLLSLQDLDHNS
jgi:hypothetical protein